MNVELRFSALKWDKIVKQRLNIYCTLRFVQSKIAILRAFSLNHNSTRSDSIRYNYCHIYGYDNENTAEETKNKIKHEMGRILFKLVLSYLHCRMDPVNSNSNRIGRMKIGFIFTNKNISFA